MLSRRFIASEQTPSHLPCRQPASKPSRESQSRSTALILQVAAKTVLRIMGRISSCIFHPYLHAGTQKYDLLFYRVCTGLLTAPTPPLPSPCSPPLSLPQISLFPASDDGSFIFLRFILPRSSSPSSHHSLSALFSRSHDSAVRPLLPEGPAEGGSGSSGNLQRHSVRYGTSKDDLQNAVWCVGLTAVQGSEAV